MDDDIFFMAGAIAFNVVVAIVPLLILGIGVAGFVLSARFGDPTEAVLALVAEQFPEAREGVVASEALRRPIQRLLEERSGFTLLGAVAFVWLGTRLVASLRIALREIFDIGRQRGIVEGKLFDVAAVVVGIALLTVNLGVTVALETGLSWGGARLGLGPTTLSAAERTLGVVVSYGSIWVLFVVAYRYVPARRIAWRTTLVAATFAAVCHEAMKWTFSWYATDLANYGSTYGSLAAVAVLFFWIYYGAVVFILGGEVGQVYTMRRAVRIAWGDLPPTPESHGSQESDER